MFGDPTRSGSTQQSLATATNGGGLDGGSLARSGLRAGVRRDSRRRRGSRLLLRRQLRHRRREPRRDEVLGILAVNGWHNVVHIATGALGLAVVGSYDERAALRARPRRGLLALAHHRASLMDNGDLLLDIVPAEHRGQRAAPADRDQRPRAAGLGHAAPSRRRAPADQGRGATPSSRGASAGRPATSRRLCSSARRPDACSRLCRWRARTRTSAPAAAAPTTPRPRPAPVARVAHRLELEVGELLGGEVGELGQPALEPVAQRLAGLDRHEGRAQQAPRRR